MSTNSIITLKNSRNTVFVLFFLMVTGLSFGQTNNFGLKKTSVNSKELLNWTVLGEGKVELYGSQVAMQESDNSKGIMLVSPEDYSKDVIVRYKVMALTPASVLVALLSVSDVGESDKLTIPEDYDGSLGLFTYEKENYFFAFKNGPHNVTPFVKKSPNDTAIFGSATENTMIAGVYYNVEVGQYQGKLWLTVDGKKLFETEDKEPLNSGHIALRIRGTAGFKAGCLIKDMEILSNESKQVDKKQPVIGLDNWFNREYDKETGKLWHYLWTDTTFAGYSDLGNIYKEKGAVLKTIEQNPTPEILNKLDVYIIVDPDSTSESANPNYIFQDDINAITNWVNEGGVLLMHANNGPECEFTHYNKLAEVFGFQFIPVSLHPIPNDDWETGAETNLPNHPLFKDVDKIFMKNTASIKLTSNSKSQAVLKGGDDIMITETRFGKGRVIAVVDPWFFNEYIDHNRLPESFQNKKAAYNMVDYVLTK